MGESFCVSAVEVAAIGVCYCFSQHFLFNTQTELIELKERSLVVIKMFMSQKHDCVSIKNIWMIIRTLRVDKRVDVAFVH